jgi:hypothetical protein
VTFLEERPTSGPTTSKQVVQRERAEFGDQCADERAF